MITPCAPLSSLLLFVSAVPSGSPSQDLTDKTLVVWASPADLEQRAGSALTLDDGQTHFDGIVFGEIAQRRWMAGSNFHQRSQQDQEALPEEIATSETFVQIAISYQDRKITIYRNAAVYASYETEKPLTFGPESLVLFGRRHLDAGDDACFRGRIDDARIYSRSLSQEEIAGLKPNEPSQIEPWAWWTFEGGGAADRMGRFSETLLLGGAQVSQGCLVLTGDQPILIAGPKGGLSQSLLNAGQQTPQDPLQSGQRQWREKLLADPHRPVYHFVAPEGHCMPFDPNGALFWNGRYHLCYIFQDERGHCWGHASSQDLLHWRWHPTALFPGPGDVDRGIFSGNCFVNKEGEATMLYHGVNAGNCIATSAEPDLDHWTKLASNPIIPNPTPGSPESKLYQSWDPHGWVEGDAYYAIFGGNPPTLFKAASLDQWSFVGRFMAHDMPGVDDFEDVSCPDFFPLGKKHMLLCISHPRGCRYYLGRWEGEKFIPEVHQRMNWPGGTCFAPESLLDDQGRRIMWAWVLDQRSQNDAGWSGVMTLPRVLSLDKDDTLKIEPVAELKALRTAERTHPSIEVPDGTSVVLKDIQGDCMELELTIKPGKARRFGLKIRRAPAGEEETVIACDRETGTLSIDLQKSSMDKVSYLTFCMKGGENPAVSSQDAPFALKEGEALKLRVFLDHSILEVYANGRQCLTQRIYPSRPDSVGLALFSEGGDAELKTLKAWDMAPTVPW